MSQQDAEQKFYESISRIAQSMNPPTQVEYQLPVKKETKTVSLDHIAAKVKLYDQAVNQLNEMTAHVKALREELEAEMADAQSAKVNGVEVFTYNWKNSYRTKELQADHGHLAAQYMRPSQKMEFDIKTFAQHHPAIARLYQTREFRRTSGIQVLGGR